MAIALTKHPLSPPLFNTRTKKPKSFRDEIENQLQYPVPSRLNRRPPSFSPQFSAYKRKKKIQFRQRNRIEPQSRPLDSSGEETINEKGPVPKSAPNSGKGKASEQQKSTELSSPRRYELPTRLELRRSSDGGFKTVVSGTGGYQDSPLDWSFYQGPRPYVDPNPNVKGKGKEGDIPQEDAIIDERPIKKRPTWDSMPDFDFVSDDYKHGGDDDALERLQANVEDAEMSPRTESDPASNLSILDAPLMSGALPPSPATNSSVVSDFQIPNPRNVFDVVPLPINRFGYIRPVAPYDPNIFHIPALEVQRQNNNNLRNRGKRWTKYVLFLLYRSLRLSLRWLIHLPSRPKWAIILSFVGYLIYCFLYYFLADYVDDTLESWIYTLEDSETWTWLAYLLATLTAKSISTHEDDRGSTRAFLPDLTTKVNIIGTEAPTVITTQEKSLEDQLLDYMKSLETDTYPDAFRDLAAEYPEADIYPNDFWDPTTYPVAINTAPITSQLDRSNDDGFKDAHSYYVWSSEDPRNEGIPTYTTHFPKQSINYTSNDEATKWEEIPKTVTVTKTIGEWTYESSVIGRSLATEDAVWIVPKTIDMTANNTIREKTRSVGESSAATSSASSPSSSNSREGRNSVIAANLNEEELIVGRLVKTIVTSGKDGEEIPLGFVDAVHTLTPEKAKTTARGMTQSSQEEL